MIKRVFFVSVLTIVQFSYSQGNSMPILGKWIFQSMTTITKAQREEITIVYKDENNIETLSFDDSGEIVYDVMNDGVNKTGRGVWYADQSYVSIIVDSDTTYGTYEIENGFLTIICLLYTSPSPRDLSTSRMPSSA